jgi:hypothetical protein
MHHRVRWEVLERFVDPAWGTEDAATCAKLFSRIDRELRSKAPLEAALVCQHFPDPAKQEISAILEDWQELLDPANGTLVAALRTQQTKAIRQGMVLCRALNRRFLELSYPVLESITAQQT